MRRCNTYRTRTAWMAGAMLGLASTGLAGTVQAADVETIKVVAKEFGFQPATIEMEQGETVRLKLVNQGQLSHNLHMRGLEIKTGTIQTGSSDTIRVTAPEGGTLEFYCAVPGHEQAGMTGEIIVD